MAMRTIVIRSKANEVDSEPKSKKTAKSAKKVLLSAVEFS